MRPPFSMLPRDAAGRKKRQNKEERSIWTPSPTKQKAQHRLRLLHFNSRMKSVHGVNDEVPAADQQNRNTNPQQNKWHNDLHWLPSLSYRGE
jgi:hypothetical protein